MVIARIMFDGEGDTAQQAAIRFVREHHHTCHAFDDGTIRIGIDAREVLPSGFKIDTTELLFVNPTYKKVKEILGY